MRAKPFRRNLSGLPNRRKHRHGTGSRRRRSFGFWTMCGRPANAGATGSHDAPPAQGPIETPAATTWRSPLRSRENTSAGRAARKG